MSSTPWNRRYGDLRCPQACRSVRVNRMCPTQRSEEGSSRGGRGARRWPSWGRVAGWTRSRTGPPHAVARSRADGIPGKLSASAVPYALGVSARSASSISSSIQRPAAALAIAVMFACGCSRADPDSVPLTPRHSLFFASSTLVGVIESTTRDVVIDGEVREVGVTGDLVAGMAQEFDGPAKFFFILHSSTGRVATFSSMAELEAYVARTRARLRGSTVGTSPAVPPRPFRRQDKPAHHRRSDAFRARSACRCELPGR